MFNKGGIMQIQAACVSGTQKVYGMSHAILLYSERGGQTVFASVHDIQTSNEGVATIAAGTPVSKTGLVKMMQLLVPEDYAPAELLGNHILAKGSDYLVWYCKPQKRQVWFKNDEIGQDVSATTDHPGLVFIIGKGHWYVFAVKGANRPKSGTPLYLPQNLTVWKGGRIYPGNIESQKGKPNFRTEEWE